MRLLMAGGALLAADRILSIAPGECSQAQDII